MVALAATMADSPLAVALAAEDAAEGVVVVTLPRLRVLPMHLLMRPQAPRMLEDLAQTTEVVVEVVTVVSTLIPVAAVVLRNSPCRDELGNIFLGDWESVCFFLLLEGQVLAYSYNCCYFSRLAELAKEKGKRVSELGWETTKTYQAQTRRKWKEGGVKPWRKEVFCLLA